MQVRREGESQLGTKVEVKNMNSFAAMQKAIDFEISRQVNVLPSCMQVSALKRSCPCYRGPVMQVGLHRNGKGHELVQETRSYDESKSETFSMRSKEGNKSRSLSPSQPC